MKEIVYISTLITLFLFLSCTSETDTANMKKNIGTSNSILWNFDNLATIGGHNITVVGSPKIIDTPDGKALEFDGEKDAVFFHAHPLKGVSTFTLEVIFRPDAGGLPEQRFFHLQENDNENRLLIETRLTEDNQWYLDTFMKSDETDQTLVDKTQTHPVGKWYSATLVFDGREMRHYVNGVKELSADIVSFTPPKEGKTSAGVRINKVYWFKGAIRTARFTPKALSPEEFLKP